MKTNHRSLLLKSALLGLVTFATIPFVEAQITNRSFVITTTPDNSIINSGVTVAVNWTFDATLRKVDISLVNLSGIGDIPGGTLYGFGFDTPFDMTNYSTVNGVWDSTLSDPGTRIYRWIPNYSIAFSTYGLVNEGPYPMGGNRFDVWAGYDGSPWSLSQGLETGEFANISVYFDTSLDASYFDATNWFTMRNSSGTGTAHMGFDFGKIWLGGVNCQPCYGCDQLWYTVSGDPEIPPPEVPEPSTYGLLGCLALGSLVGLRRLRLRKA